MKTKDRMTRSIFCEILIATRKLDEKIRLKQMSIVDHIKGLHIYHLWSSIVTFTYAMTFTFDLYSC